MARRRLNQTDLAGLLGQGQPWVSRRMSGSTPITVDDLEAIAEALRVPVSELLGGTRLEGSDTRPAAA